MIRVVIPPKPPIVRMARRLCCLFCAGLLYLAGVATGLLLIGYQARVATQQMAAWGGRLNVLETMYQQEHPKAHVTTKAQAQIITARIERDKEGR